MKKPLSDNLFVILAGAIIIIGWIIYTYDSPDYKFLDFLSKYITAAGIIIAILAYYGTTTKDRADDSRSKKAIAYNLINQWHLPPFTDYRKDIFTLEKIDSVTQVFLSDQNAGGFATILLNPNCAHYRSSLFCVLNFFEHMAISIEKGVADEQYLKEFFKSILIEYQSIYNFYILYERKKEAELWIKFSNLVAKWS